MSAPGNSGLTGDCGFAGVVTSGVAISLGVSFAGVVVGASIGGPALSGVVAIFGLTGGTTLISEGDVGFTSDFGFSLTGDASGPEAKGSVTSACQV